MTIPVLNWIASTPTKYSLFQVFSTLLSLPKIRLNPVFTSFSSFPFLSHFRDHSNEYCSCVPFVLIRCLPVHSLYRRYAFFGHLTFSLHHSSQVSSSLQIWVNQWIVWSILRVHSLFCHVLQGVCPKSLYHHLGLRPFPLHLQLLVRLMMTLMLTQLPLHDSFCLSLQFRSVFFYRLYIYYRMV